MKINPQKIFSKFSFQEFRHSGGMTESSPAIFRRVCRRKRAHPGGDLRESPVAHKSSVILSEGERKSMFGQRILPSRSRRTRIARTQRCGVPQAVVLTERWEDFSRSEMNPLRLFPVKTTRSFDSARPAVIGKVCSPLASLRMTELENNTFAEISGGTLEQSHPMILLLPSPLCSFVANS